MLCHLFGGLTPMNIGDMAYTDFRILAANVDAYEAEQKKNK